MRKKLGFSHTPSKSCIWWNAKKIPIDLLDELLVQTVGKAAHESLLADSSSYTYNRYVWKENTKGGRFEHLTLKHHILLVLNGCVVTSVVADGERDDSHMLTRPTEKAPPGSVYLLADRKYCCKENCAEALRKAGFPAYDLQKATPGADYARGAT